MTDGRLRSELYLFWHSGKNEVNMPVVAHVNLRVNLLPVLPLNYGQSHLAKRAQREEERFHGGPRGIACYTSENAFTDAFK